MNRQLNRRTLLGAAAATGALWTFPSQSARAMANEEIRVGFISCGGRSGEHMRVFHNMPGVVVAALCDPDESQLAGKAKSFPKAKTYADLRDLLEDDDIDAVVIATCNHWHCLAAIWAMEAGKDVYVEKPLSHSQWEGEQTINAARKYNRICQVGTQQRSDPMQAEIKKFLHEEKGLGKIQSCRVNRYGVRQPIGKRATPLAIGKGVNYDLWLGPAQDQPIYRDKLQYDWHWDFNTGSGEMGNWGVHVLDDARNNVFLDKVSLPSRIMGGGGRVAWGDAGNTPNVHFVYFDTGEIPTVIGLSNLTAGGQSKKSPGHPGPGSGYIAYCEGGRYEGQRGRGAAFDNNGKLIREFKGNSGGTLHQENFIACVRSRDASQLNTDIEMGHYSTGWCNLANIAYRVGDTYSADAAGELSQEVPEWGALIDEMQTHVGSHSVAMNELKLSPMLEFNPEKGAFTGASAAQANALLKREYRAGYEVPAIS
ncbi:Gfo/Idh/MocA family protein [Aureliella helgolandensis]|uniref:Inositol 2-dehydrogenase n=1 Tax=Aureliella helgolandensis TaxID=2527968 RepID=A0A518GH63_9BACT|nr:Gfo/Idh/MocA family oxidoreductase [Aureliella helgolandensis]QDV27932.1 Inositol 2-dehydrogenase [Aureliella helgolandensis]